MRTASASGSAAGPMSRDDSAFGNVPDVTTITAPNAISPRYSRCVSATIGSSQHAQGLEHLLVGNRLRLQQRVVLGAAPGAFERRRLGEVGLEVLARHGFVD